MPHSSSTQDHLEALLPTPAVERFTVLAMVFVHASLLCYSATRHSPTHLEPAFVAAGISHWQQGSFELYGVNPPLPRMLAVLPVLVAGCETDWSRVVTEPGSRAEFVAGDDFVKVNGDRTCQLVIYARWACILLSTIGVYIAYLWARSLYGALAGLSAMTLYIFDPNLLAHGELVTPDAACCSFGLLAGYTYWRWLESQTWGRAFCAGLAELTKLTCLIYFLLWPLLWLVYSRRDAAPAHKRFIQLFAILFIAVYTINLGYAFDGFGARLGDFSFISSAFTGSASSGDVGNRFRDSIVEGARIPLPRDYVIGIDAQQKDLEGYSQDSYLRGEWKRGGWWYYYIYGLGVKVPTAELLLILSVVAIRVCRCLFEPWEAGELVLLTPAALLLLLASIHTAFSIHLRYVFPSLAAAIVFASQAVQSPASRPRAGGSPLISRIVMAVVIAHTIYSTVCVYPNHLTHFNELAGGCEHGSEHVLGSSFDWGQDWILTFESLESCANEKDVVLFQSTPLENIQSLAPANVQYRLIDLRQSPFVEADSLHAAESIWVVQRLALQVSKEGAIPHDQYVAGRAIVSRVKVASTTWLIRYGKKFSNDSSEVGAGLIPATEAASAAIPARPQSMNGT
jgi:hypothetical protein